MGNILEVVIEGVVKGVTAKAAKSGKKYAELSVEVTEALKSGDRKVTLPMSAWGGMREKCLALADGQVVTVIAKVGSYTSQSGYVNVTLSVVGVEVGAGVQGDFVEAETEAAEGDSALPF